MALIENKPCPHHGLKSQHCNGVCMTCSKEKRDAEKLKSDAHWESLSIEQKLNYLRGKVE